MAITLRTGLGRKLTIAEMDENFTFLSGSYVVNSVTSSMTVATGSMADTASYAEIALEGSGSFSGSFEGVDISTTSGSIGDLTATRITETSALEYKTDVEEMYSSNKIYQLRPVNFKWKEDQRKDVGLIAEEVQKIYPELVKSDGTGKAIGVNYSKLTSVLIKAVQDLSGRIEELENQISTLNS